MYTIKYIFIILLKRKLEMKTLNDILSVIINYKSLFY